MDFLERELDAVFRRPAENVVLNRSLEMFALEMSDPIPGIRGQAHLRPSVPTVSGQPVGIKDGIESPISQRNHLGAHFGFNANLAHVFTLHEIIRAGFGGIEIRRPMSRGRGPEQKQRQQGQSERRLQAAFHGVPQLMGRIVRFAA